MKKYPKTKINNKGADKNKTEKRVLGMLTMLSKNDTVGLIGPN